MIYDRKRAYFGPLLNGGFSMPRIQQVISVFVVDLCERHMQFKGVFFASSFKFLKDIAEHSRNDSPIWPQISPAHCESLSRTRLPICENGAIVSLKTVIDDRSCHLSEDFLLGNTGWEDLMEGKLMVIFGI